ncbi:CPBP family glutamic-type intramembrane protease [Echinicola salinicaeni]|uniref:CPBP family glutamic-type intramembrane protease n=1 Tax=Echinicola salinicaeni TaxID=2762757 RepID=UPI0016463F2B|nr:CPBP family glutamic-type intramembrane protease [Echinicola salinicaeni]
MNFTFSHKKLTDGKLYLIYLGIFVVLLLFEFFVVDRAASFFEVAGNDQTFETLSYSGVLSALMIAPAIEELFFRGYLNGLRKHYWLITPQVLLGIIILPEWTIEISIGFLFLLCLILTDRYRVDDQVRISKLLFYVSMLFSSVLFSLFHLSKVNHHSGYISFLFVMVAMLPVAVYFSYIRYNSGLTSAIITHMLYNATALTINTFIYSS